MYLVAPVNTRVRRYNPNTRASLTWTRPTTSTFEAPSEATKSFETTSKNRRPRNTPRSYLRHRRTFFYIMRVLITTSSSSYHTHVSKKKRPSTKDTRSRLKLFLTEAKRVWGNRSALDASLSVCPLLLWVNCEERDSLHIRAGDKSNGNGKIPRQRQRRLTHTLAQLNQKSFHLIKIVTMKDSDTKQSLDY